MAGTDASEGQAVWQPGGAEEDSRLRESNRHLHLAYDKEEDKATPGHVQIEIKSFVEQTEEKNTHGCKCTRIFTTEFRNRTRSYAEQLSKRAGQSFWQPSRREQVV